MGRKKQHFTKTCLTCKKEFEPGRHKEKMNCSKECLKIYNDINKDIRMQKTFDAIFKKYGVNSFPETKSFSDKVKQTKLEKYGDENYNNLNQIQQTLELKYSASSVGELSKREEFKQKAKNTKLEKYGDENYNNREQNKKTIKSKYGVDHHLQNKLILQKQIDTNLENNKVKYNVLTEKSKKNLIEYNQNKYGTNYFFQSNEHLIKTRTIKIEKIIEICNNNNLKFDVAYYERLRSKNDDKSLTYIKYKILCLKCNKSFYNNFAETPICRICNPYSCSTIQHLELKQLLLDNNINFIENNRTTIKPFELDFYLPEHNLAIEINGNYYHAESSFGKDKNYHLNKSIMCLNKNIKLIHIFEDEFIEKKDIIKSRILNLCKKTLNKIYARKCVIKEISFTEKSDFLNKNHLQGNDHSKINLGLFFIDELVSVMTFCKPRLALGHKNNELNIFELSRFCNKTNHNVVGAFEKILKNFNINFKPDKLITYADCRFSGLNPEDTIYYKCGFTFVHKSAPSYFYVFKKNYLKRYHRFVYNKQSLIKLFNSDPTKTEWQIAQENNMDRIWDCGNLKFELIIS